MKITLFTSDSLRHKYLVNLLSRECKKLYVVIESKSMIKSIIPERYPTNDIYEKYFKFVKAAQQKIFNIKKFPKCKKNIKHFKTKFGKLNSIKIEKISEFLNSDLYIIFGSSYLKGDLADFLVKNNAINIHAGLSPYYRGTDCNFWALYDENPHLVGSTIHLLSKGIDNGPILYHALSNVKLSPFEYTMSAVMSAFYSLLQRIKDKSIFEIKPINQKKEKLIRYTKKSDFNEKAIIKFFNKKIDLNSKKFDLTLLKDPFFFD